MGKPMSLLPSRHRKEEISISQMGKGSRSRNQFRPFPIPWWLVLRGGRLTHLIGENGKRKWTRGWEKEVNKRSSLSSHPRGGLALFGSTCDRVPGFHWGRGSSRGDKEYYGGDILSSIIWLFHCWFPLQFERIEWGYSLVLYMPSVRSKLLFYDMPVS